MPLAGLDLVIAIIILVSALIGLMRGFIKEVISLLSWVAALVLAIYLAPAVADILPANWAALQLRMGMAFVLVFVLTLVAASLLRWVLTQLVESTGLSGTDRVIGLVFGGVRGVVICIVGLVILREIGTGTAWWEASQATPYLLSFEGDLRELFGQARASAEQMVDQLGEPPDLRSLGEPDP